MDVAPTKIGVAKAIRPGQEQGKSRPVAKGHESKLEASWTGGLRASFVSSADCQTHTQFALSNAAPI